MVSEAPEILVRNGHTTFLEVDKIFVIFCYLVSTIEFSNDQAGLQKLSQNPSEMQHIMNDNKKFS